VDVVVVCAGHNVVTPYRQITADEWDVVMNANLTGTFFALQSMIPAIRPGGSIVTVASVAAHTGAPHHMHYAAAKAGLVNLTRSLARELAPQIGVNCLASGISLTPMGANTIQHLPDDYAQKSLLLQRYATSRRVAQMIAVLASPISEYMTGTTIDVNSGRHLRRRWAHDLVASRRASPQPTERRPVAIGTLVCAGFIAMSGGMT
jgi:3-oxoacyl-[acyl-carrier protein] reductase